jgi:hypothetical protein
VEGDFASGSSWSAINFFISKVVGFGTEQGDKSLETMLRAVPRVRFKKEET